MIDAFTLALEEQIKLAVALPDYEYAAYLEVEGVAVKASTVVSVTRRWDAVNNLFEESLLTVTLAPADYTEIVLNGHEDMYVRLVQRAYRGKTQTERRFRAVLESHQDPKAESNLTTNASAAEMNSVTFAIVTLQLIRVADYDLRLREVGGTFTRDRNGPCIAKKALEYFLARNRLHDEYNQKEAVATLNIEPRFIERGYETITVPEGTSFLALPDYLQRHYGIYKAGLGCFLRGLSWYVFSLYDVTKWELDQPRLVIFNAPPMRYQGLERTFHVVGKTITVIATGPSRAQRRSDEDALNEGTGIRYGDVKSLMAGQSSSEATRDPKRTPGTYMNEYRASNYASAYQKTVTHGERFIDNGAVVSEALAFRGGDLMEVNWVGGILDVLVPGMAVRFCYSDGGKLQKREGTLLVAEEASRITSGTLSDARHRTNVKMVLFLKRAKMV